MARPKKKARKLTDGEVLKKLFPPEVRKEARKTAKQSRKSSSK
jgi:hypothetical protein